MNKPFIDNDIVIFPPPPAAPKIQFLTSISSSADISPKRSTFMKYVLGEDKPVKINKPYGITIKNGKIYICDTMLGGLIIIDLAEQTFKYFTPGGLGQLKKPVNCSVDSNNRLLVADSERREIVVFDKEGNFITSFGSPHLIKPTDVKLYNNEIYVCDLSAHNIHIFSARSYEYLKSFPEATENADAFLHSPTNLDVAGNRIYVSDFGEFNIKLFDSEGSYLSKIGGYGNTAGHFIRPKGIAVDHELNLHVVDAGFENVQIFDKDGGLLMYYGGNYTGKGKMWLPAKVFIDYDNLDYFEKFVHSKFKLKYILLITNQFGPDKVNIYGFLE